MKFKEIEGQDPPDEYPDEPGWRLGVRYGAAAVFIMYLLALLEIGTEMIR